MAVILCIAFVFLAIGFTFISKLQKNIKAQQWEQAEGSFNLVLISSLGVFLCLSAEILLDALPAAPLGLALMKIVGTLWPYVIAIAIFLLASRKRIKEGKATPPKTDTEKDHDFL